MGRGGGAVLGNVSCSATASPNKPQTRERHRPLFPLSSVAALGAQEQEQEQGETWRADRRSAVWHVFEVLGGRERAPKLARFSLNIGVLRQGLRIDVRWDNVTPRARLSSPQFDVAIVCAACRGDEVPGLCRRLTEVLAAAANEHRA
ncbi:hypothetical protein O9K51_05795 [Purpureocillium lavendulum]|uniref:Uncharacterized protein n=1 Tax=Purpureocillium lavendulum TaxID=1247861 RepID=A0AB34FV50_9HYPO|nr:hypothetical protein O9K51_05795 [Purpureocillium lavendulum]